MAAAVMEACKNVRRVVWMLFMCCIVMYRVLGIYPLMPGDSPHAKSCIAEDTHDVAADDFADVLVGMAPLYEADGE
jgi:hypothetical protein